MLVFQHFQLPLHFILHKNGGSKVKVAYCCLVIYELNSMSVSDYHPTYMWQTIFGHKDERWFVKGVKFIRFFSEPFPYFRPLSAWLHIIGSRQSVTSHQGPHWGKPLCKSGASCSIECAIWFFWHISDTFCPHTPTLHIFYFAQCKRSTTPSPSANCENLEFCFCFYIFDSTGVQFFMSTCSFSWLWWERMQVPNKSTHICIMETQRPRRWDHGLRGGGSLFLLPVQARQQMS